MAEEKIYHGVSPPTMWWSPPSTLQDRSQTAVEPAKPPHSNRREPYSVAFRQLCLSPLACTRRSSLIREVRGIARSDIDGVWPHAQRKRRHQEALHEDGHLQQPHPGHYSPIAGPRSVRPHNDVRSPS